MATTIMAVLIAAGAFVAGVLLGYFCGKQDGILDGWEFANRKRRAEVRQ